VKQETGTLSTPGIRAGAPAVRRPFLFLALEAFRPLAGSARYRLEDVDEVLFAGRAETRRAVRSGRGGRRLTLSIPDPFMSQRHALLVRSGAGWKLVDQGSKNGCRVDGDRIGEATLTGGALVEMAQTFFLFETEVPDPADARDLDAAEVAATEPMPTVVPALRDQLRGLERMARSQMAIVLSGETGTGKEVLGRAIHGLSGRSGPLITVNCGALAESIIESELFGSKKGAFSGAEDRPGLIRAAHKGTLFLDEIGDMPRGSQVKLLRAIQEREVIPVGGTQPTTVDVRYLAASHHDLREMVAAKSFRADLHARLAGFHIHLPALRERRADLGLLVASLLRRHAGDAAAAIKLAPDAGRALLRYPWPANVRELDQALGHAVVLAGGAPIAASHLPIHVVAPTAPRRAVVPPPPALTPADEALRSELVALLQQHNGNVAAVAREMGKDPKQVRRWMKRFQIEAR
jgi:sigma-54 dependent transcriptional regulator, acetoin dehydrogenase operon transcriptional activator AcoR